MKSFGLFATAAILSMAAPACAQLVGGGLGGGLGGNIGGLGGSAGGSLGATLNRSPIETAAVDDAVREARARARDERRAARTRADHGLSAIPDLPNQTRAVANQANVSAELGTSAYGSRGSVDAVSMLGLSDRHPSTMSDASTRLMTDPMVRTRGTVAATAHGMRRVTATASGVPVFVPQAIASVPVLTGRPPVIVYPVYSEAYYYGGGSPVVIRESEVPTYMDRNSASSSTGWLGRARPSGGKAKTWSSLCRPT